LIAVVVGRITAVYAVQGTPGLQSTIGKRHLFTGLWWAFMSLGSSRRRWCSLH